MRLLELKSHGGFSLTKDLGDNVPPYAILSHTWGNDDEEPTIQDLMQDGGKNKAGYRKILFCEEQAARDGLQFVWVDTCCIDKSNSTELAEAINSMFRWYREAAKCYVYLLDVSTRSSDGIDQSSGLTWGPAFQKSRWFTRGWTLQELIAPESVDFFSEDGKRLGDKRSLEQQIHEITRILIEALQGSPLSQFSVSERISWADNRETKRKEDKVYSLMGIFDTHMTLIYGEGREKAFRRLHNKIDKQFRLEELRQQNQSHTATQNVRKRKEYPEDLEAGRAELEKDPTIIAKENERLNLELQNATIENKMLQVKLEELVKNSANIAKDNELLKLQLQKATTENEILKAIPVDSYRGGSEPLPSAGPIRYSPTDFYTEVLNAHETKTPSYRIVTTDTGERLLAAGATWDCIIKHPLYKRGLVDVGDVSDRLKKTAMCDGQGPVFWEREIIDAIEKSVASASDELL
ncbi:HET domain containing protein [Hyaloscypha variabilis]